MIMNIKNSFCLLLAILPLLLTAACESGNEKSLFNGKNLENWKVKAKPEDLERNFWTVRDGFIEANTMGHPDHDYVWLQSVKEYEDFELSFEFQAFRNSPGNSGIQVRSRYDEESYWLNGPQIDIHPPGFWRTGMMWDETRGNQRWIFPEIPEGEWVDSTMALNQHTLYFSGDNPEWNYMKVTVIGTHIEAWLNDVMITDYDGKGILDDDMHRNLEVGMRGHIAFQIHSGDELRIRYRNILIREL
jgi:hypothetical protein